MSRVIKFRGLNAKGEFVYGLPSHDLPNSTSYYSEYSHRICWHLELRGITNQPIKNGTLGQFTGLHDANGTEIYDGDVVECDEHFYYEISWSDTHHSWHASDCGGFDELPEEIKVIGNIYQNPELLGGAK